MTRTLLLFITLSGAAAWLSSAHAGDLSSPSAWGQWRVTEVRIDDSRTSRLLYQRNDRRLVKRQLHLGTAAIRSNLPEQRECRSPSLVPDQQPLDALLRTTMPTAAERPAESYGLALDPSRPVTSLWLRCAHGRFGPALPPRDAVDAAQPPAPAGARTWLLLSDDGQRAWLRWYDATLLVLTRVPD